MQGAIGSAPSANFVVHWIRLQSSCERGELATCQLTSSSKRYLGCAKPLECHSRVMAVDPSALRHPLFEEVPVLDDSFDTLELLLTPSREQLVQRTHLAVTNPGSEADAIYPKGRAETCPSRTPVRNRCRTHQTMAPPSQTVNLPSGKPETHLLVLRTKAMGGSAIQSPKPRISVKPPSFNSTAD